MGYGTISPLGLHMVPQGHVGVYWRGGRLLDRVTEPGYHMMFPLVTAMAAVQTTLQTDKVTDIPCGTSGGTVIRFERVEVVNQLRKDMVIETIRNYTIHYDRTWIFDKVCKERERERKREREREREREEERERERARSRE